MSAGLSKKDGVGFRDPPSQETFRSRKYRQPKRCRLIKQIDTLVSFQEDDELSFKDEFQFILKTPTSKELQSIEETKLLSSLDSLNESYKQKNASKFLKSLTEVMKTNSMNPTQNSINSSNTRNLCSICYHLGCKNLQKGSFEEKYEKEGELDIVCNQCKNPSPYSSSLGNLIDLIAQNIKNYEQHVKLFLVGAKAIGKSYFISKCFGIENVIYNPTFAMEIKKKIIKVGEFNTKIEFFDTNEAILDSTLCETYYQLCHGFVVICDPMFTNSIQYAKRQIERIFSFGKKSEENVFFILNTKYLKLQYSKDLVQDNLKHLDQFLDKFQIKINYLDLSRFNEREPAFLSFLTNLLYKENNIKKEKYNSKLSCSNEEEENSNSSISSSLS